MSTCWHAGVYPGQNHIFGISCCTVVPADPAQHSDMLSIQTMITCIGPSLLGGGIRWAGLCGWLLIQVQLLPHRSCKGIGRGSSARCSLKRGPVGVGRGLLEADLDLSAQQLVGALRSIDLPPQIHIEGIFLLPCTVPATPEQTSC